MSEKISLPPLKKYVGYCVPLVLLSLCFLLFLWFFSDIRWKTVLTISVAINIYILISFLISMALHYRYTKFFPRTVSVKEGILYVSHADPIFAIWAGYQEEYLLSECVWFQGYVDGLMFCSYGICMFPVGVKPGIVIYHIPTSHAIACGFTCESYHQWCGELRNANIRECRKISRFYPLITLLFLFIGIYLSLVLIFQPGLENFIHPFIQFPLSAFIPVFFVLLGGYISGGGDLLALQFRRFCFGIFLFILFMVILYIRG